LAYFAGETIERVSVLVVLQISQALARLRERHSATEINAIDSRESSDDSKQYQQFPDLGIKYLVQKPLHVPTLTLLSVASKAELRAIPFGSSPAIPVTKHVSYPVFRGQKRMARTIAQAIPQPTHVIFG
jgi:hypothetical protein